MVLPHLHTSHYYTILANRLPFSVSFLNFRPVSTSTTLPSSLISPPYSSNRTHPRIHIHNPCTTLISYNKEAVPHCSRLIHSTSVSTSTVPLQVRAMATTATTSYKLKSLSSLDLKDGDKVEAEIEGIDGGKVLLVRLDGRVHGLTPNCTHYGAPLAKGVLTPDGRITCPWHGGMTLLRIRILNANKIQRMLMRYSITLCSLL